MKVIKFIFLSYLLIVLCVCTTLARAQSEDLRIVPDPKNYSEFLLFPWKDGAPTLVVFKDPMCGYCIEALKRKERLQNYNVFLFWSPILSKRSEVAVDNFFRCKRPVSETVLAHVIERTSVGCAGEANQSLRQMNDRVVSSYQPGFVPQYWFGGQQTSIASLNLVKNKQMVIADIKAVSPVRVPWNRYSELAVSKQTEGNIPNIALVLPQHATVSDSVMETIRQDKDFNWYVLSDSTFSTKTDQEFRMLNGIENITEPTYILEGKRLDKGEIDIVLPYQVRRLMAESLGV